jgi:hypothetical protein
VERVQAAEEGAAGDDAAEGGAGRAGAAQVHERGRRMRISARMSSEKGRSIAGGVGFGYFFLEEMGYGFWRERARETLRVCLDRFTCKRKKILRGNFANLKY